jgi:hypothetical protein
MRKIDGAKSMTKRVWVTTAVVMRADDPAGRSEIGSLV